MKISFKMELIGDDERQYMRFFSNVIDEALGRPMGTCVIGRNPNVPWVAEIIATSSRYGFERRFVKFKKDYTESNSKGSRGVYAWYLLESNKCYEIKEQLTRRRWKRYFLLIQENGSKVEIDRDQVIAWLNDRSE